MNIRWNVILSIIAFCLLGWFYSLNRDAPDLSNLVKKPDSPDYIGNKMETTVFSPEGKKQYVSLADNVKHYTVDGHIYSMLIHLIPVKQRMLLMLWYHRVGN